MSHIAIVKARGAADLSWRPSRVLQAALRALGAHSALDRLRAVAGQSYMPQLTLPYLAGLGEEYNRRHGTLHTFALIDDEPDRIDLTPYDMVWLTATTSTAPQAYCVADRARRLGIPAVMGGIHASVLPDEAARHASSVVVGEGERPVFELLADFDAGRPLARRYRGGRASGLTSLAAPRWRDAVVADYCPWVVPVQTSRGCRNGCAFCSTTRFQGPRRRHRPAEDIASELRQLQDQGVLTADKTVFFTDNNIVWDADHRRGQRDSRYARQLFEAIAPLGINWVGQGEIAVGDDPELVELMAASGCYLLLTGLETLRSEGLDGVGKPSNDVSRYEQQITVLQQHDIALIGCFIFGLDGDTAADFETTAAFIERWIDVPQLSVLTPFPGTALYRRFEREGRLLHRDWSQYDITHVVFRPQGMSAAELEERYRGLARRIYSYSAIMGRALRYATRRRGARLGERVERFAAIAAPNLVYRGLTGLDSSLLAAAEASGDQERALPSPRLPFAHTPTPA